MGLLSGVFSALSEAMYIGINFIRHAFVIVKGMMQEIFQAALDMMNAVVDKLEARITGKMEGAAHFFRMMGGNYQEGTKAYSIDEEIGEWKETIVTRNVTREAVPDSYMDRLSCGEEYNDTRELKNALAC